MSLLFGTDGKLAKRSRESNVLCITYWTVAQLDRGTDIPISINLQSTCLNSWYIYHILARGPLFGSATETRISLCCSEHAPYFFFQWVCEWFLYQCCCRKYLGRQEISMRICILTSPKLLWKVISIPWLSSHRWTSLAPRSDSWESKTKAALRNLTRTPQIILVAGYLCAVSKMWTGFLSFITTVTQKVSWWMQIFRFLLFLIIMIPLLFVSWRTTRGHSPASSYLVRSGDLWFFFEKDLPKILCSSKHSVSGYTVIKFCSTCSNSFLPFCRGICWFCTIQKA